MKGEQQKTNIRNHSPKMLGLEKEAELRTKNCKDDARQENGGELDKITTRLSYHALDYVVNTARFGRLCQPRYKHILHNISGIFHSGMNAIMGPTGCGKTSLLDVLAGRTEPTGIAGQILVNGCKLPKNFKCMTGYVVQDDVVMGTLTIRENLIFSANLRLESSMSNAEKERRVEETITELGLEMCADTKVGNEFIRGVSGGERKRCNIGMELIIKPAILFLDEPTTGLDSSTANSVMSLLHSLSRSGRTVIFSIHQPRYSIFKLCDQLTLLAAGRTIYHGPASEALTFFSSLGYECEAYNCPPDFFLDVINGDVTVQQVHADNQLVRLPSDTDVTAVSGAISGVNENRRQTANSRESDDSGRGSCYTVAVDDLDADDVISSMPVDTSSIESSSREQRARDLADKYHSSQWSARTECELEEINAQHELIERSNTSEHATQVLYTTSMLVQLRYVSKRTILNLIRSPQECLVHIAASLMFAVILGGIFYQINDSCVDGLQNRIGALFFVIMNTLFTSLSGIELFIKDRVFLIHENASGFYRVSAYFLSKVFCALLPIQLIPLCLFTVITYLMMGFRLSAVNFFIFFFNVLMTSLASSAVVYCVSAWISVFAIANLICVCIFATMLIFGGLFVNISTLPSGLRWLQYLSIVRYSNNVLLMNELGDMTFKQSNDTSLLTECDSGNMYLAKQGISYESAWGLWQNIMGLCIITVGLLVIAYVVLRRIKKVK